MTNQLRDYPIPRFPDPRRLPLSAVGRAGCLDLVFEPRGGRTVLAHAYAEPPLRVGPTFAIGDAALLIPVCSGPGIFAGDTLRQSIHVRGGARVALVSQSALQVHPSDADAPARIDHRYVVDDEGELHCHWDPLIPFAGARVEQRLAIDAAPRARVYWSDALMSGRAGRGERWQFDRLAHELRVRVDGAVTYLERFALEPHRDRDAARDRPPTAHDGRGCDYFGTAVVRHDRVSAPHAETLQRELDRTRIDAGVDVIGVGLLVARLAAPHGVPFASARAAVRAFALATIFEAPELANRK